MATWAARKADGMSVAMADEAHLLLQAMPGDEVDQLLAIGRLARSVAGEHDDRVVERPLADELRRGLDRMAMAFQPGKPRGMQHDLGFRLDPPPLPELGDRARRHDQRIERGAVDAAIDDADARPRRVHALGDQLRRVERVGDDAVAARP